MSEQEKPKKVLLPENDYQVILDSYTEVENSKKTGKRATLKLSVAQRGSEFNGQELFCDINPENPNKQAEEISMKLLNSFLKSTNDAPEGLASIDYDRTKINDFRGIKVVAVVKQKMAKEYINKDGIKVPAKLRNQIDSFKAL